MQGRLLLCYAAMTSSRVQKGDEVAGDNTWSSLGLGEGYEPTSAHCLGALPPGLVMQG